MRDSKSWKVTAAFRLIGLGLKKSILGLRSLVVGFLRVFYHSLPLSEYRRNALKNQLYSIMPFLFRHTVSYRYWKLNEETALDEKRGVAHLQRTAGVVDQLSSGEIHEKSVCSSCDGISYRQKRDRRKSQPSVLGLYDKMSDKETECSDRIHDEWFNLICQSLANDSLKYEGITLPGFPDVKTQINTVGSAGKSILIEADAFFRDVVAHFRGTANWMNPDKTILDFGCGWGRIARFFLLCFKPENIFGIDIDADLLSICRDTFTGSKFYKCEAFPPTALEGDSIDFIVGYSVFSHLSEIACHQWMSEFKRILKTGGMVALTTRGRPFFDYCISLKGTQQGGYSQALANLFDDFDVAKRRYDEGHFVHSNVNGVTGGGVREAGFYGESFVPERYATEVLSKYLSFLEFSFDSQRSIHPTIYFKKE